MSSTRQPNNRDYGTGYVVTLVLIPILTLVVGVAVWLYGVKDDKNVRGLVSQVASERGASVVEYGDVPTRPGTWSGVVLRKGDDLLECTGARDTYGVVTLHCDD